MTNSNQIWKLTLEHKNAYKDKNKVYCYFLFWSMSYLMTLMGRSSLPMPHPASRGAIEMFWLWGALSHPSIYTDSVDAWLTPNECYVALWLIYVYTVCPCQAHDEDSEHWAAPHWQKELLTACSVQSWILSCRTWFLGSADLLLHWIISLWVSSSQPFSWLYFIEPNCSIAKLC